MYNITKCASHVSYHKCFTLFSAHYDNAAFYSKSWQQTFKKVYLLNGFKLRYFSYLNGLNHQL